MEERDFYLDELSKAHKEYFETDKKYHQYWEQFFYSETETTRTEAKRIQSPKDWRIIEKMEKELDEKREKFREAEKEWHLFLSRNS